jgi:hypothetical protein
MGLCRSAAYSVHTPQEIGSKPQRLKRIQVLNCCCCVYLNRKRPIKEVRKSFEQKLKLLNTKASKAKQNKTKKADCESTPSKRQLAAMALFVVLGFLCALSNNFSHVASFARAAQSRE